MKKKIRVELPKKRPKPFFGFFAKKGCVSMPLLSISKHQRRSERSRISPKESEKKAKRKGRKGSRKAFERKEKTRFRKKRSTHHRHRRRRRARRRRRLSRRRPVSGAVEQPRHDRPRVFLSRCFRGGLPACWCGFEKKKVSFFSTSSSLSFDVFDEKTSLSFPHLLPAPAACPRGAPQRFRWRSRRTCGPCPARGLFCSGLVCVWV